MTTNNAYNTYRTNSINTATPRELTLMLYNGAIKFCNQAILSMEENDMQNAHNHLIRVEDIIDEFIITLDTSYPVAESMASMYDYINRRLSEANMQKDIDILIEVLGYLRELRDTWKEAMKLAKLDKKKVQTALV